MAKNLVFRDDVLVKFVKRANMWCKTYWNSKGEQKQDWSSEEPNYEHPEG